MLYPKGVKKGDRISIYMPMVIELVVAMLACARIGAVHSIVVCSSCCLFLTDQFNACNFLISIRSCHSNGFMSQ